MSFALALTTKILGGFWPAGVLFIAVIVVVVTVDAVSRSRNRRPQGRNRKSKRPLFWPWNS